MSNKHLQIRAGWRGVQLGGAANVLRDSVIEVDSSSAAFLSGPGAVIENKPFIVHGKGERGVFDAALKLRGAHARWCATTRSCEARATRISALFDKLLQLHFIYLLRNFLHMKKLLPSLLLLALLGACSHKNDADVGAGAAAADAPVNEAAQRAEEERSMAESNAAEQKVAARYAKALLPLLAGSFGGACQIIREGGKDAMSVAAGSAKDKVDVSADGKVLAPGFEHDLNQAGDGLSFTRMFEGGKPSTALATAGGAAPDWSFVRNSADQETVRLTGAGMAIGCNGSAAPLRDQPLWPLVSGFFRDGTTTGACSAGGLVRSAQTIKIDAAGVTVGGHSYAFGSGLQLEMVIAGGGKGLHYSVAYPDGKKFNIMLDGSGHFATLMAAGEGGVDYDCARPAD